LIQRQKVEESKLRLGVARNQLLPELNLKGGYGYNGLGRTPDASMDTLETRGFPSWSLGLELRIPLGGGIKGQNDFSAAKVSLQESIANLNAMQTQIANALDTSIHKTQGWEESIQSYQTVVEFNESLLKTQIARLNAGKVEPRKVFEVEADLFESRQSLAQARVARQRTLLELELAEGTILKTRNLDLTREQLRQSTRELLANHALSLENSRPVLLPPVSAAK
jgi:outer membrane protein TolC